MPLRCVSSWLCTNVFSVHQVSAVTFYFTEEWHSISPLGILIVRTTSSSFAREAAENAASRLKNSAVWGQCHLEHRDVHVGLQENRLDFLLPPKSIRTDLPYRQGRFRGLFWGFSTRISILPGFFTKKILIEGLPTFFVTSYISAFYFLPFFFPIFRQKTSNIFFHHHPGYRVSEYEPFSSDLGFT